MPVLAEILQQRGFRTAAFVSSIVLSKQSGLDRGFQTYSDSFEIGEDDARFLNTIQKRGDKTVEEAVAWLREPGRRAALRVGAPLRSARPVRAAGAVRVALRGRPYDGEVAWSDELVGRLDTALGAAGLRDDTLFVVTSDHGEGLGEHGEAVHGFFVYETTLHVPLVVRGPGITAGTKAERRRADDRSAADAAGAARPRAATPKVSGRSLAAALRGATLGDEPTFAESLVPLVHYGWSDLRALRLGSWKYILAPRPELYDLENDPGERRNLIDQQPARARALRSGLEQRLKQEQTRARAPDRTTAAMPPDLLEKLGALGYVSGAGASSARASGADPKDKIEEYKILNTLMREGLVSLREQRYRGEPRSLQRAVRARRRQLRSALLRGARARRAQALARGGRPLRRRAAAAAGLFRRLPRAGRRASRRRQAHARARGAPSEARRSCRTTRASSIAKAISRGTAAISRWRAARGSASRRWRRQDALVRVKLGELYRDAERPADAARLLREAVTLDPSVASYWNSLGMVLGGSGDLPGAEQAFREAATRDRGDAQYAYNLGLALGAAEQASRGRGRVPAYARPRSAVRACAATPRRTAVGRRSNRRQTPLPAPNRDPAAE